jgi:hypothetical protein
MSIGISLARGVQCRQIVTRSRSKTVDDPAKLRELAAWYREFAEQSGNPAIWDGRLRTAEDLEAEASQLETRSAQSVD